MAPWIFAYRRAPGVPFRHFSRGLPRFGHGNSDTRYRVVEDDEVAEELREKETRHGAPYFRWIAPDHVEATLDESAEATIGAIEAGEFDDVLDLLLFAEREAFGARVTVIDAIAERNRRLEEELGENAEGERTIRPEDVVAAE